MEENFCKHCAHFLQHYGLRNGKLYRVYCGHCMANSPKHKRPDAKACANYTPGKQDEDTFVSKEYLSRRLLEHVLQMDFLPEILQEEK